MTWLARLFQRRTPHEPPESAATIKARQASEQMAATDQRIDAVIAALREQERAESLRRIKRPGNFVEGWLVPERHDAREHGHE